MVDAATHAVTMLVRQPVAATPMFDSVALGADHGGLTRWSLMVVLQAMRLSSSRRRPKLWNLGQQQR